MDGNSCERLKDRSNLIVDPGFIMSAYKDLVDWIESNGGYVSPLVTLAEGLKPEDGIRGIVCLQDLPQDYEFLRLPNTLLLNPLTSAQFQKHLKDAFKKIRISDWTPLMWSIILERQDESSYWKPYLNSIPHKINLPCEWPEKDQAYLKTAKIYSMLQTDFSAQDKKFELVARKANINISNLKDEYRAAGSVISAYSFCDGKLVSMVPFADLLNHKTGCNNARLFYEDSFLSMRCIRDCLKDEQLYNTYGELGNTELLLKYGFICLGNPLDEFSIDLEDPLVQKFLVKKQRSLKRLCRLFPDGVIPISSKSAEKMGCEEFKELVKFEISRHSSLEPCNDNQRLAQAYLKDYQKVLARKAKRSLAKLEGRV